MDSVEAKGKSKLKHWKKIGRKLGQGVALGVVIGDKREGDSLNEEGEHLVKRARSDEIEGNSPARAGAALQPCLEP